MGLLTRCGRTVFNLLPLRGRKRRPVKLCVLLFLSAAVFVFGMSGMCLLDSRMCAEEGGGEGEWPGQLRSREPAELYGVKLNPGLHRNIKGGEEIKVPSLLVEPGLILKQPNSEKEQQTQLNPPPLPPNEETTNRGREAKGGDGVLPADRPPKVVKADDRMLLTEMKSEDVSMEGGKVESPANAENDAVQMDPIQDQKKANTFKKASEAILETDSDDEADARIKRSDSDGDIVAQNDLEEQKANEQQQQQPQTNDEVRREIVSVLEEGEQLSRSPAGRETVFTMKKKNKEAVDSDIIPEDDDDYVGAISKQQVGEKPSLEPEQGGSPPPGVVAVKKNRDETTVDAQMKEGEGEGRGKGGVASDNGAPGDPGGVVKMIRKGELPSRGGGGGGGREEEEEKQMTAIEMANAIESGEMCKTVCPPFAWSDWSPCSKACGKGRRYRKALYKFVCQSSELCPLNRVEESICDTPCKFDPEKYGGPTGLDMYPINPLNPAIYPEDKRYMCGHWLVEYETLHHEILTGKRPPRYLVYSTGKGTYPTAGGIAPRLKGITTAFFLAVLLDRAFMIEWVDPPGLDLYLEPKSFDWSDLSKLDKFKRGPVRDIGSWRSSKENGVSSQWYMSTNFSTYLENEVEVLQGHRYDFTYAVLRNPELMPKAFELGVDRVKCRICCAFHMLFKMTERFEGEMDTLLKSLGAPQKHVGAIQVRTKSNNVQDAVKFVDNFIKCATKAGKGLKMSSSVSWVPIFNNRLVVHIVHKKYGDKLKIPINIDSATRTVHTHLGNLPPDTEIEVAKAVQERTFKEFFLTINSTIIIRRKGYEGSFGNVADAIRRFYHELGTVHTFLVGNTCTKFPDTYKIE